MIENTDFLWVCAKFSKSIQFFCQFDYRNDRERNRTLLECVKLYGKCINKNETWQHCKFAENVMEKKSVKDYDKSNIHGLL